MKRVIIEPLKENYKIVVQRVTSLEKFHACPYSFQFCGGYKPANVEKQLANERGLFLGNKFHEYIQNYSLNLKKKEGDLRHIDLYKSDSFDVILEQLSRTYPEDEFTHSKKMIDAAIEMMDYMIDNGIYNIIATEVKLYTEVELGDILLILSGSADAFSYTDGLYSVLDRKTSKTEYMLEDVESKIQKFTYPWIIAQTVGREKLREFSYLVTSKHATPRNQRVPIIISDNYREDKPYDTPYDWLIRGQKAGHNIQVSSSEVETFMKDLISNYGDAIRNNVWASKNKIIMGEEAIENKQCIWCSLKNECPAFKLSAFNDIF